MIWVSWRNSIFYPGTRTSPPFKLSFLQDSTDIHSVDRRVVSFLRRTQPYITRQTTAGESNQIQCGLFAKTLDIVFRREPIEGAQFCTRFPNVQGQRFLC